MATVTCITGEPDALRAESLEQRKSILILKAKLKYGYILPVMGKSDLFDCFTQTPTHLIFWFNTSSNNTRIMSSRIAAA